MSTMLSVLVVDDDFAVRDVAVRALEFEGFTATAAACGELAIELLRGREFDCVVLDLTMPTLSGHATFHALRQLRAVPVVIASGRRDEQVDQLLQHPHVHFLPKPFTVSQLKWAVDKVCKR